MGKVVVDISMSLDGFIAGPNASPALPLGKGGERLHHWIVELESWRAMHGLEGGRAGRDAEIVEEAFRDVGAVVMGRRMFDEGVEPWGDNPPFHVPVFIVTHHAREKLVKEGGTSYTFVTEGVERAVAQAATAAAGHDVSVAGGASVIQQALNAGLLDEIQVHLIPVLLGAGRRLFDEDGGGPIELEIARVEASPGVIHTRFRMPGRRS
jgi:dihydrofolate reductase